MFLFRKHIIMVLICLEILLLASVFNVVIYSIFMDDFVGQVYGIFILAVAASEISIGLALVVIFYRIRGGVSLNIVNLLKD